MLLLRLELLRIHFEEIDQLLWVLASNIMESGGGDVVGLALLNKRVVFEKILDL